jgi:hypothetical protein
MVGGSVVDVVVVGAATALVDERPKHATPSATTTSATRLVACPPRDKRALEPRTLEAPNFDLANCLILNPVRSHTNVSVSRFDLEVGQWSELNHS